MRRRLIDPAVADLQAKVADARRSGTTWRALRALSAGYVCLTKVLVIAIAGDLRVGRPPGTPMRQPAPGAASG